MTNQEIIALVIVISVFIVAIGLLVFLLIRKHQYHKFVSNNSKAIEELENINSNYNFNEYDSHPIYHHTFDNKGHFYKTSEEAYFSKIVRDNLEYWFSVRRGIVENQELFKQYESEVLKIDCFLTKEECKANKLIYRRCNRIETKSFNSLTLSPDVDIDIVIELQYISKKGQVNITKSRHFDFVVLNRLIDSVSTIWVDKETYEKLASAERGMLSDNMRYDVLKRDGFRCVLCGTSAKDGAVLHVDHIIPISKGGKTEMSNLRTLCEKCNMGKSDKIE